MKRQLDAIAQRADGLLERLAALHRSAEPALDLLAHAHAVPREVVLSQPLPHVRLHLGAQVALTFWLGVFFIALGAFSSAYSAKQYSAVLRTLSPEEFPPGYAARWGLVFNGVVAVLGVLLIVVLVIARTQ